jgi:glycosyltransferase involved in cell wall biosynthesis
MRLLLIEPAPHGGLLHYLLQLGDGLAERGHEVELLTARDNELMGRTRHARMRAELPRLVAGTDNPPTGLAYRVRQARVATQLVRCWARILKEARTGGHDALITGADFGVLPAAVGALALTAVPGRPKLIRIAHNLRRYNRWGGDDLFHSSASLDAIMKRTLPRFDLTLLPGERVRAEYERDWPSSRTAIVPHGDERLFADEPPPPASEERVLFFGEWRKVKGLPVLMDAFDELLRRRSSVRLTIAGTPVATDADADAVRRWAVHHGEAVEVIDRHVPVDEVAPIFARARVVVTPYLTGAQSGVIALAGTMGRAVVTSDVGELATAIGHGEAGCIVPPNDPVALAGALERVLADPDLASRYGEAGRRRAVESTSWEHAAERVETAVQELLSRFVV